MITKRLFYILNIVAFLFGQGQVLVLAAGNDISQLADTKNELPIDSLDSMTVVSDDPLADTSSKADEYTFLDIQTLPEFTLVDHPEPILRSVPMSGPGDCGPVRILPLGDSNTYGTRGNYGGYRGYLLDDLSAAGYTFTHDFVGSRMDYEGSTAPPDLNHEGWPGWHADQIRDNIYDGPGGGNWLMTQHNAGTPVDVVLLHIGTNDISGTQTVADIAVEIDQILDEINQYEAATGRVVWVLLARIINRTDNQTNIDDTTALNAEIQTIGDTHITAGDEVIVVDMENEAGLIYTVDTTVPYDDGDMYA
ncbi:MAG: hypothetical protein KAT29_14165, partial [Anaerolineales bacterium]|nr:hypothetical protein [Anaerolineales bacterium]